MLTSKKTYKKDPTTGEKMIVLNKDAKAASSSPLNLSPASLEEQDAKLSFSDLLKGIGFDKDIANEKKELERAPLILSLEETKESSSPIKNNSKTDQLLSLLKNDELAKSKTSEALELNPKLTQNMSTSELKTLIADAKEYLKSKILQSDAYKISQAKELPNTMRGLADFAKTLGLDVSKITLEDLKGKSSLEIQSQKAVDIKTQDIKAPNTKASDTKGSFSEVSTSEQQKPFKTSSEKGSVDLVKAKIPNERHKEVSAEVLQQPKAQILQEEKNVTLQQELKSTPLFKAQKNGSELTTEQLVQTKTSSAFKVEEKTPKQKADETLKLLLRGEKPQHSSLNLTADFSVATARVIAPSAMSETTKHLESLLKGEPDTKSDTQANAKVDGLGVAKADSFEVKLNEAKQMIKYLSSDVKSAIDDYKSPFSRVKVQLNPQNLGEIELTVVQRGKSLHVNLSSNNAAINALAMNANDLKVQLSNNGINNATLNFSNNSEGGNFSGFSGGQQNSEDARKEYEHFQVLENEDVNEEGVSSLEIIVPRYI